MWAKFSNALKSRHTVDEPEPSSSDAVSPVLEKHPNVSELQTNEDGENRPPEVPFPASKHRNGIFRRVSRSGKHDSGEPSKASSVLKLPLRLPKKVKSQMSLQTNGGYISFHEVLFTMFTGMIIARQFLNFPSTLFQIP
jgi:hypothetical protein